MAGSEGGGGGVTTHVINIQVQGQQALTGLQQQATQAQAAVSSIGKGSGASFESIKNGAMNAYNQIANVVQQAFDAAKALSDMAKEGAKLQTLDAAFKQLGGSAKALQELRDLTGGLVSDEDLQQASNLAKLFKLPEQEIPKLIKLAQGASAALGTTVAKAMSDTFTAASRQSKMIADNMGIVIGDMSLMYKNFAKEHGKTVTQLTDKDKQLAFVQKMIAEGGRQMELATIAQGNAALKAEAQMANFEAGLKRGVAEAFASSGAFDMMGGVLTQLQTIFASNGEALTTLVMPAFEAVAKLIVPLVTAFGALLPLLEPITKLFGLLGATLTALAPVIGLLSTLVAKLASFIIDIVFMALEPLLRAAADVSDMFGIGMGDALNKAANALGNARTMVDVNTAALKENAAAAKDAAAGQDAVTKALQAQGMGQALKVGLKEGLDAQQIQAAMEWAVKGADMRGLAAQIGRDTAKEFGEKYKASGAQAMKLAAQKMAQQYVKEMGIGGESGVLMVRELSMVFEAGGAAIVEEQRKSDARLTKQSINTAQEMIRLYNDAMMFGQTTLADSAMAGATSQEEALAKLELKYEEFYAALEQMDLSAPVFESTTEKMNDLFALASEQIAGKFEKDKGKGKGGKAPDWFRAEYDARLALMDDTQRQAAEIETRYQEQMSSLHADQVQLRIDLVGQMVKELDALEAQRVANEKARALELANYFRTDQEAQLANDIAAAEARAAAMREIARSSGQDNLEMMRAIAAQEESEKLGAYGAQFGGLGALIGEGATGGANLFGEMYGALFDNQVAAEEATQAHTEKMAALYQSMGSDVVGAFVAMAAGGADMRETMFKLMGSMFGQLSTAFLAWATAEGALLSGNPFAAATAAIALGAVASLISAFGSRGKGSGGGGAKGSNSNAMARRSLESRKDNEKPQTVIYNYGFATPDSIARSVSRGDLRGQDLRGRERV